MITQQMNQPIPSLYPPDINLVKDRLGLSLTILDGVTGIGIGEYNGTPCIVVLLENDSLDLKAHIPTSAEGYRVITEVTGPIFAIPAKVFMVRQSGDMGCLIEECGNLSYLNDTADYIIEATVTHVETSWDELDTGIFTYTTLEIDHYVKGTPYDDASVQITTQGGTIGDLTEWVEDQPIFYEGKHVRLYLVETPDGYSILCRSFGVQEI